MSGIYSGSIVAGLDIGTTKVVYLIAHRSQDETEILGIGQADNPGMKHGVVTNIEETALAVQKAKEEAERMASLSHSHAWIGVSGTHVESFDSRGMVPIKNKEVTQSDIENVIEAAKAVALPNDRQILHVLPIEYIIDNQNGITDPIGMVGVRLECAVHIITGSRPAVQNLSKVAEKAGVYIEGFVLQQLSSAYAVAGDDEKALGVSVIDMGGGTCDMVSFIDGAVYHTHVLPVGGLNFTHDVAMGLRTTQQNAEKLKKNYGSALVDMVNQGETIEVVGVGGRPARTIARKELCEILEARSEETLHLLKKVITEKGLSKKLGSGIILTGGASQLPGLVEMGDFILDIPVRLGIPNQIPNLSERVRTTEYATAIGLVMYGFSKTKKVLFPLERSRENPWMHWLNDWGTKIKNKLNEAL